MGNSLSAASTTAVAEGATGTRKQFTKGQILALWFKKALATLASTYDMRVLLAKLNLTELKNQTIDVNGMAKAFNLPSPGDGNAEYDNSVHILYESLCVIGGFPYLQERISELLTSNGLVLASLFHSQEYASVLPDYDYLKLLFISLCIASDRVGASKYEKYHNSGTSEQQIEETESCQVDGNRFFWHTFKAIQTYDNVGITTLSIRSQDLIDFVALLLLANVSGRNKGSLFEEDTSKLINKEWPEFEKYATSIVLNMDLKSTTIGYDAFKHGVETAIPGFFQRSLKHLFSQILNSNTDPKEKEPRQVNENKVDPAEPGAFAPKKKYSFPEYSPTKVLSYGTISFFDSISKHTNLSVTSKNIVKLYSGSENGFSIRSLEQKIIKWQAPTIFIVSGKRLKSKTIQTNKRYQQFSEEFPRFFRTAEDSKKPWQKDTDRITYAVIVSQPWRVANKKNFGDVKTTIISLEPRLDIYHSTNNPILKGELIYFNTLGLGIGFGNDQPINKNGVKRYLPGDTSLTIEANLEFSIFRHIVTPTSNSLARYFQTSKQSELSQNDFEDRFMITDLEVWGIGSTKELEEQKKQWEWEAKQAEARQSVNLKNMGEERAFLEMVGLVGNKGGSGGSV